ncbi:hypothetical protein OS11_11520 [Dickeya oryzae]
MEIRIVASVQAKPEFINEVAAAVRQVVAPSRQEEGNLQYELHEELNKKRLVRIFLSAGRVSRPSVNMS